MSTQEAIFDHTDHIPYPPLSASMENEPQFIVADGFHERPEVIHSELVDVITQCPVDPGLVSLANEAYVAAHDFGGPQNFHEPQLDVGSTVPPPMADSSASANPVAADYAQVSGSFPDLGSRPLTWRTTSQETWSLSVAQYEFIQHPFDGFISHSSPAFTASSGAQKLSSSPEPGINIILEDPNFPHCFREKRIRSRTDLERQKQAAQLLRKSGGACIWCYRSKKKCGPSNPCPSCASGRRKCIRDSAQICLFKAQAEGEGLSDDVHMAVFSPPSHEALRTLYSMVQRAAAKGVDMRVVVNIRQPDDRLLDTWALDVTEAQNTLSSISALRLPVGRFVALAKKYLRCIELAKLENEYYSHSLVQDGLAMSRLFMATRCLAQTRIYVGSHDIDWARLMMSYLLAACSRDLAQMSESFSAALCEALRHKDVQDACDNEKNRSRTALNPLWVATALYYRIVTGLLELQASPVISKIFDSFDLHLTGIRCSLWSILKCISPTQDSSSKTVAANALNEQVPVLPSPRYFDLALWLAPLDSNSQLPPPKVVKRHGDPFAEACYEMEAFLDDELTQSGFLLDAPQPIQECTLLAHAPDQVLTGQQDSVPLSNAPIACPMEMDTLSDSFDPMHPCNWDAMKVIDNFYDENRQGVLTTASQTADGSASLEAFGLLSTPLLAANGVRNMI